jgi:hypothetical protein
MYFIIRPLKKSKISEVVLSTPTHGLAPMWKTLRWSSMSHVFLFFLVLLLLYWVGVHCGIYGNSYNISNTSYLNSPPLPFSFIPPCPHSWNSFIRCHFSIYIHVYSVYTIVTFPQPSPTITNLPDRTCSALLFSNFIK